MHGGFALTASLPFFPVGNGDMTLLQTDEGTKILIDLNIPAATDDCGSPTWIFNDSPKSMDATSYRE